MSANFPDDLAAMSPSDAAGYWLFLRDSGTDLEQHEAFKTWLAQSEANRRAWQAALAGWNMLGADPLVDALRRDALAARPERRPAPIVWMAMAACITLLLIAGSHSWVRLNSVSAPAPAVVADATPTFTTGASAASFSLDDGSQVTLNANSAVSVHYSDSARSVRLLRGEAYFRVRHNPARPFAVHAQDNVITDIGTEFDVNATGGVVSVILAEGIVAVDTAKFKGRTLQPGQKIEIRAGASDLVSTVDLADALAWRLGFIEFQDERLDKVVAEINKFGGAPARIIDPSIRAKRVSGRFRTGNPSRFARSLAETYHLRIVTRADGGADIAGH